MDDCMSSTNNVRSSSLSSTTREDSSSFSSSQDSGWTLHFVDLITNNNSYNYEHEDSSSFMASHDDHDDLSFSSSMEELNNGNHGHVMRETSFLLHRCNNKLVFKRRKTKAIFIDQDLEDTATSPLFSHKIYDSSSDGYQKEEDNSLIFQEKRHISEKAREDIEMGFIETGTEKKGTLLGSYVFGIKLYTLV